MTEAAIRQTTHLGGSSQGFLPLVMELSNVARITVICEPSFRYMPLDCFYVVPEELEVQVDRGSCKRGGTGMTHTAKVESLEIRAQGKQIHRSIKSYLQLLTG